ncbi:MAG: UbiX family flavin prenyltransferase [Syntrophorhabdaceae bacterium]|nr:UbiX family flavin prenyltransferase [Syntrophorhabdaceae bacterium]MDD5242533.1 UbiX family flavin prenyltransferase [Syntrophorhabdaceae bacterium]
MKKIIVAISGASGIQYGVRMLEVLSKLEVETHLVITKSGINNLSIETKYTRSDLESMASYVYDFEDVGASIASGSFPIDGMVVAPCSIKTLSAIANSYNSNLVVRAADVTLKERRRLVLLVRETPLHEGHLELMLKVTRIGGIIMPPIPAFYHLPETIMDIVDQTIGKALDLFSIDAKLFTRWGTENEELKVELVQ